MIDLSRMSKMSKLEVVRNRSDCVKVSIITVVRNAVDKIEPTLLSVLGQDYGNVEYIVIDGASTDGTKEVIGRYKGRISAFISEPDDGIYEAMNKGVMIATGEWIGIMNAGDSFPECNTVSRVFGNGDDLYKCDVIYGDAIGVDGGHEYYAKSSDEITAFKYGPCYRQGASFVRRETHRRHLFDLALKKQLGFALDYEQMYRMYKSGVSFRKVPLVVLRYELRGVSTISPFKCTYYNYLITHDMKCGVPMKIVLVWLTLWRGLKAV